MKTLLFLSLFFFSYSSHSGQCNKAFFDKPMNQQFTESLHRYFSTHKKGFEQDAIRDIINSFANEGKKRKETLRQLMEEGHLRIDESNPLFEYILTKSSSETVKLINEKPHLLYEGTFMDLPPFFLMVFLGEKPAINVSLKVDPTLVHSRNPVDEAPLHYAVDAKIASGLLLNEANPDAQNKKGHAALHNIRNPAAVKAVLYYQADPTIKDHSGIGLIKYHEEQVRNQQIIDLLVEARENQKPERVVREKKPPVVIEKTEEERWLEEEIRREEEQRATEEKQIAEEQRRRAKERRKKEQQRIRKEAQKRIEQTKDDLISQIASSLATVIMQKTIMNGLINFLTNGDIRHSNPVVRNAHARSSNITVFEKEFEEKFEEKVREITMDILITEREEPIDKMEKEVKVMENELKVKLKNDIYELPIRDMRKMLKRAQDHSLKFDQMRAQLVQFRNEQNYSQPALELHNISQTIDSAKNTSLMEGFFRAAQSE